MNTGKVIVGRYVDEGKIGEGSYGIVHKARDTESNCLVAIKRIKHFQTSIGIQPSVIRELAILKHLGQHENIISLMEVIYKEDCWYLIFEFASLDLYQLLKQKQKLTLWAALSITRQILNGLLHCHERRVIHRDIKPSNILLDENGVVKVCDFGLSRTYSQPLIKFTPKVEILWYRSPEVLLGEMKLTLATDMWSVGCLLYQMLTGELLFTGKSEMQMLNSIFRTFGSPTDGELYAKYCKLNLDMPAYPKTQPFTEFEPKVAALLTGMLIPNPNRRWTVKQALLNSLLEQC